MNSVGQRETTLEFYWGIFLCSFRVVGRNGIESNRKQSNESNDVNLTLGTEDNFVDMIRPYLSSKYQSLNSEQFQFRGIFWLSFYSNHKIFVVSHSRDSWMYPYQRTPMGNPYISPI